MLRFAHPLIATAVLDGMNALDSRNLHAALAEVVSDRGARAVHLARAVVDPDGAVADEIEEAALRLSRRGSPRMAAELMGHSARLTPHHAIEQRVRRTLAQVMQSATAGNLPAALALATTLLDQLEPGRLRAEVITGRVVLDPSDAEQLLRRALDDVPADGPPEYECLRGRLLGLLGWLIALHLGRVHEGLEYARAGLEIGRTEGDVVLVAQAASAVSTASLLIGRRADELMDEACRLDSEVVASQLALWPKVLQGRQQLWDGRIREARANLDAMYKCAVAAGAECQRSHRLCDLAHLELAAGDLDVAQRYVDEGLEAALDCGDERAVSWLAYPGGLIGALRGDVDGVAWSAERLDWWAARAGERPRTSMAAHVRGVLAASQGDWESGLGHLMTAQSILDAMGVRHPGMVPALPLAIQLAGLADQPDRVEALVAKLARRCAGLGSPWADLQLRAATGHLQLLREEQAALATLQASHLGLTRLGYGLDAARLGCLVVASGLRAGGRRDVLPVAEATFETFRRNGVRGWDAVAADLLERVRGCGSGALTATEQQVATLVAAGGRNREVASALFVSESTVEAHLTRIYRKLGLRNRAGAGAAGEHRIRVAASRAVRPRSSRAGCGVSPLSRPSPTPLTSTSQAERRPEIEPREGSPAMGVLDNIYRAIETYPRDYMTVEIVQVEPPGGLVHEDEKVPFRIQVANDGPLDANQVSLLVEGLNGTKVQSNGSNKLIKTTSPSPARSSATCPPIRTARTARDRW